MNKYIKRISAVIAAVFSLQFVGSVSIAKEIEYPDIEKTIYGWETVFEDDFEKSTPNWDAPAGNYMQYQYSDGRFSAKDGNANTKARIKGKSWKRYLLTFDFIIPDFSKAGCFFRIDLGSAQNALYDSILIRQNKISFYKSGVVGETKIADCSLEAGKEYSMRIFVYNNTAMVEMKDKGTEAYMTMGKYSDLYKTNEHTVCFGHNLLQPSIDNVAVMSEKIEDVYTGPFLDSLKFYKDELNLQVGQTENLRCIFEPELSDLPDNAITWSVSDESVIQLIGTASKARAVNALSEGEAVITAVSADGKHTIECRVNVRAKQPTEKSAAKFSISSEASAIPPDLFGINYQKLNDLGRTNTWYIKRDIDIFNDVGFQSVRGPDGTAANYYMYKDGYLLNANVPGFNHTTNFEYTSTKGINNGMKPFLFSDLFQSANEMNKPYNFVMNVAYQSVDEIVEEIKEIKKNTNLKLRIEMGNEFYLNHYGEEFFSVDDYIAKCKEIYKAVKEIDPEIQLGIVILDRWQETIIVDNPDQHKPNDPLDKTPENNPATATTANNRYLRWEEWNRKIAENPDCYDAVVPHEYTGVHNIDDMTQDVFMDFLYINNENRYQLILDQAEQFPGKEFWITEYGGISGLIFGGETNEAEKGRIHLGKTPAYAMHYMERIFNFIKTRKITVSDYHCLVDNQFFGVVQDRLNVNKYAKSGMVALPPYYTLREVGKLLNENTYYYDMTMTEGGSRMLSNTHPTKEVYAKELELKDVGAWGIGDEKGVKNIVFSNRTNKEITVSVDGQQLMPVWEYGGDPVPDFLANDYAIWRQEPRVTTLPRVPLGGLSGSVVLEPYSIMVVSTSEKGFNDEQEGYWANSYINELVSKEVAECDEDGNYRAEEKITRRDFAKMITNALKYSNDYSYEPETFTDVNEGDEGYKEITAAACQWIIRGYDDGSFAPNDFISREDAAVMMMRGAEAVGIKERDDISEKPLKPLRFNDKDEISDYALSAVVYCASNDIMNGDDKNKFTPDGNVTRAQAAKLIYKLIELINRKV